MLIAVTVMIASFRQTVNDWVSGAISGDIFFGPAIFSTAAYDHYLPPEILPELREDPEIADIYLYRCVRLPFRGRQILVIGGSFQVLAKHGGLWFRQGETKEIMQRVGRGGQGPTAPAPSPKPSPPTPYRGLGGKFEGGPPLKPAVVISETLAEAFHYREGDSLILPTPAGPQDLTVAGVFYDYRTDGPSLWMDIGLFRRFWRDSHLNAVRLYLRTPGGCPRCRPGFRRNTGPHTTSWPCPTGNCARES